MLALLVLLLGQDAGAAVVTLSNGERVEGTFSLTEGRKMEVFDVQKSKRFTVEPSEIARISVTVEEEKLEQGWMFKEEGNHDKIKLPFKYPLRKLMTEITLTSGAALKGHVACVFYIDREEESKRFFLLADQKGEKNQPLEELLYVKEIVLPNRKVGDKKLGTIRTKGVAAIVNVDREISIQPPLANLLPGRYDVFLFGDKIRYGLSGSAVKEEDLRSLEKKMNAIEEFFTKKRIVAAAKEGEIVRALVELTRVEESHDSGWQFARWEVWIFEPTQESWDIRKRLYLRRDRYRSDKGLPTFEYAADDRLKGVSENAEVE